MGISLAFDLGASGGKAVVGQFDGQRLHVQEIHRFRNEPVRVGGRLHWDVLRLLFEIGQGMRAARSAGLGEIGSLGIDAWGCDFGLLDHQGELIGNPLHYRDEGSRGAMEAVLEIVPRAEIFARTGCQFIPVNTLYQLFAMQRRGSSMLDRAATLLLVPDLLRAFLTGEKTSEYTNATTTQFLNIASGDWDRALLDRLGLPSDLLTPSWPRQLQEDTFSLVSPRSLAATRFQSSRWPATTRPRRSPRCRRRGILLSSAAAPGRCLAPSCRNQC